MKQSDDPVIAVMRYYGIPVTRENYLELAYMGDDVELDAETESYLPLEIQMPVHLRVQ